MSSQRIVFGSIAVSIAFVLELTLVPLLLPAIQRELGLSLGELTWFFNSYGVAVAIGVLLGGWLGDRFDTRKVFACGVLFFSIGAMMVAAVTQYEVMIFARALQGFGGGIFSPLVPLLLTRSSAARPGKVLILWGSISGYVAALAPLFYGNVLSGFGWNFAFAILAVVSIAAVLLVQSAGPEAGANSKGEPARDYAKMLETPELWGLFGYVFCTYGAISFYLFSLPLRLAENRFDLAAIGLTLSIVWLSFSIASTLLRNAVDEPRVRAILLAAPVLLVIGFGLIHTSTTPVILGLSGALIGIALACSNAPSTFLILQFAPEGNRAISASLDISFARLGGVAAIFALASTTSGVALVGIVVMSIAATGLAFVATRNFDTEFVRLADRP